MGFDIEICDFSIENNKAVKQDTVDNTYLSYNWSDLNKICPDHFLHGDGKCPINCNREKLHLWYFRKDCHARRGDDIANKAAAALKFLLAYGVEPGTPDQTNDSWYYGCVNIDRYRTVTLPPKERVSVLAYHIKRFVELGNTYSDYFFIGDHNRRSDLKLPNGNKIPQDIISSSDSYSD